MNFSKHAETRIRQRGFSKSSVNSILENGTSTIAPGGATKVYLRRKDYQEIVSQIKKDLKMLERAKDGKVIMNNGLIITVYK